MQIAERIFVKENPEIDELCRRQTPVYNKALWMFRTEFFKRKHMDETWHSFYDKKVWYLPNIKVKNRGTRSKKKKKNVNFIREMMRWLPIYRDAVPNLADLTIKRVTDAVNSYWNQLKEFNNCKSPDHYKVFLKGREHRCCPACNYTGEPKYPKYIRNAGNKIPAKSPIYLDYKSFSIENHRLIILKRALEMHGLKKIDPILISRLPDQKQGKVKGATPYTVNVRIIPTFKGYWVECVHDVKTLSLKEKINTILENNVSEVTRSKLLKTLKNIEKTEKRRELHKKRGSLEDVTINGN